VVTEGLHGGMGGGRARPVEDVDVVAVGQEKHIGVCLLGEGEASVDGNVEQECAEGAPLPAALGRVDGYAVDA
jgi:hypothetical protein